jgi:hypothetical protein
MARPYPQWRHPNSPLLHGTATTISPGPPRAPCRATRPLSTFSTARLGSPGPRGTTGRVLLPDARRCAGATDDTTFTSRFSATLTIRHSVVRRNVRRLTMVRFSHRSMPCPQF